MSEYKLGFYYLCLVKLSAINGMPTSDIKGCVKGVWSLSC